MPYDVYVYGILATGLLVAAASMLINWRGIARLQRERFENQTFRRNFPVGVMRLDHRDVILDANQIAEWTVQTTLQQEGEQGESDSEHRKFGDLIFPWIVPVRGFDHVGQMRLERPLRYEEHLKGFREWPTGCSYYAVVRPVDPVLNDGVHARVADPGREAADELLLRSGRCRVLQVTESPIIGEPPGRVGGADGARHRDRGRGADTLGESSMVPRTDLILLTVLGESLKDEVTRAVIRKVTRRENA